MPMTINTKILITISIRIMIKIKILFYDESLREVQIYGCKGFTFTGYVVPGCGEDWSCMLWEILPSSPPSSLWPATSQTSVGKRKHGQSHGPRQKITQARCPGPHSLDFVSKHTSGRSSCSKAISVYLLCYWVEKT